MKALILLLLLLLLCGCASVPKPEPRGAYTAVCAYEPIGQTDSGVNVIKMYCEPQ